MVNRKSSSDIRSVSHIRTRTARVGNSGVPYIAYLKISCLEMEKARREKEKLSALARVADIDARLAEIEAEKDAILRHQGERSPTCESKPEPGKKAAGKSKLLMPSDTECFKIKY